MYEIQKFILEITPTQIIEMPEHARVVHVDRSPPSDLCIWVTANPANPMTDRQFEVRGTGESAPEMMAHLGAVRIGSAMCHVFEPPTPTE